jgi:DNA-binding GntR family transcriptional regulator
VNMANVESVAALDSPRNGARALPLRVHFRLRGMILRGELPPGSVLLQAEMARQLGVSRTPMREAFRLLQEEGLIDAAPDKRARVRDVDAIDLDSTYGARIMLEVLGVSVTVRQVTDVDVDRLWEALAEMRRLASEDRMEAWFPAHREFHRLTTQAVAPQLARQIAALREHCERYVRLDRFGHTGAPRRADAEHEQLVLAFMNREESTAVRTIAAHLARTALSILADIAPEREPVATRAALRLVGC